MMRPGFLKNSTSCASSKGKQPTGVTAHRHENEDLNTLEQAHVEMINSLHSVFNLERSRSLDHYFHHDLADAELQIVNAEQVLSRFIYHQQAKDTSFLQENPISTDNPKPRGVWPILRKVLRALAMLGLASSGLEDTRIEDGPDESNVKRHLPRQYVIVVPQLWLWKIDSKSQNAAHSSPGALISKDVPEHYR